MIRLSVLIATCRRIATLERTLEYMALMELPQVDWQLIVVDNAGDTATQEVCDRFVGRIPIEYLVFSQPGKNAALNFGLNHVDGDLIVFSDDDVLPSSNWLNAMRDGAAKWPDHLLFAGRVLPKWPRDPPEFVLEWVKQPDQGRWTYSVLDNHGPEGPCARLLPLGNNMAVRRRVFDEGLRFDESIGPKGTNYAMGSETEFNLRLKKLGHEAVFLPESLVYHQIRPEQMTREWLVGRAFREGRGEARLRPDNSLRGLCRSVMQTTRAAGHHLKAAIGNNPDRTVALRIRRALATGRLYESIRMKLRIA